MHVIVAGAGIAGLSTAHALARAGAEVTVLDPEAHAFSHSSGRNAAIFRPLERSPGIAWLAQRSAALLDDIVGSRDAWLSPRELLLVGNAPGSLAELEGLGRRDGVAVERLYGPSLVARMPLLRGGRAEHALAVRDAGVLDPHVICTSLLAALRRLGARIELGREVARLNLGRECARGVALADGSTLDADAVVLAAGAWASALGASAGLALPLVPVRRHLAVLESSAPSEPALPTVWDVELEAYFRPESGGWLASPCDETCTLPGVPSSDPAALELLAERLAQVAPALADARVRRSWACLRTFAPDRTLVAGADPRVAGLFWTAGLGGFGMTTGTALGEVTARAVLGDEHPLAEPLGPARLLQPAASRRRAWDPLLASASS
ncbi:MAG: FAD-binding oxidoreductase [Polyangiaceae bacterium]|nr:FAD-binding oxidoreductase [Polyangiaceae bacterium]